MRYLSWILALAGTALLTGCSSLISLNPFVADGQTTTDPALVGTWKSPDAGDNFRMKIEPKGTLYTVHYSEGAESYNLDGRLMRAGEAEFLDVVNSKNDELAVQVHMVARVWHEGATLKWVFLDSDWFRTQAKQALATQPAGDRTLITTPTQAAGQFLKKFGADARA